MADFNGSLFYVMKGLTKFSGTDRMLFENWREKTCTVITLTRPETLELMDGWTRPTAGVTGYGAAGARARTQAAYDKANQDLYAILSVVAEASTSFLVRKHKATTESRR